MLSLQYSTTPTLQKRFFRTQSLEYNQTQTSCICIAQCIMHEMSIAQSVLDIILQESRNHKIKRVLSVALKVGEMSAVEVESLRFCFELITKGTLAEGARLDVEKVQITCRCQDCGSDFTVQELLFSCPACTSNKVEMLSGKELSIESFEGE